MAGLELPSFHITRAAGSVSPVLVCREPWESMVLLCLFLNIGLPWEPSAIVQDHWSSLGLTSYGQGPSQLAVIKAWMPGSGCPSLSVGFITFQLCDLGQDA